MIAFWLTAAILSSLTSVLLLAAAQRARRGPPAGNPSVETYKRLVQETDSLAARGLMLQAEKEATHGEAARRLLRAAKAPAAASSEAPRWAAPALCIAAPILAASIYLAVGAPGTPDRAHARRVAEWRSAPERLSPAEAAAVLASIARERPRDAEALSQLARARLASGDAFGAVRSAEAAARLEPNAPGRWLGLAEALLALEPPAVTEARRALERARRLRSDDLELRYWLGRTAFTEGDTASGQAEWTALIRRLPRDDPRRAALEAELAAMRAPPDPALDAAISGMVEALAARLRSEPLDPQGWARLVRAYGVLGRTREQAEALTEARRLFGGRPEVIAELEAAAAKGRARSAGLRGGG